ncbi:MAG: hypothetical protein WKG01_24710 [Kofleriaceae bacterium]
MRPLVLVCTVGLSGCHVTARNEITRPIKTERVPQLAGAIARPPTLVLGDAGELRFVEPLACPSEEIVTSQTAVEVTTGPNLATFVVGTIATAVGGVLLVRGLVDDDRGSNPFTYAGVAGLGVGLPFAIGPWIGNRTELRPRATGTPVRRPGPSQPCGSRALAASRATITSRGIEIHGRVDRNGGFSISAFQIVDAFDPGSVPSWDVAATVETPAGARTVTTRLDGAGFTRSANAFLAAAKFDTRIEPMRLVPGITAGTLRASLTATADGPAVRLVLPLENAGPGPAWALRGHVIATETPAIDGRVIYIGALAKGATANAELVVPVSPAAATALRNATIAISIELRDAHGTAPSTPVRFRGQVLVDAPRP